jgi:predicted DNA-binding protein (MmcQ/YjbR family)
VCDDPAMATADIPRSLYAAIQAIALALPEAVEKETWGHPTFRVRDKIFTGMGTDADTGVTTTSMKAAPGEQESLLAGGHPFFRPKYVGNRGWIGIVLDADTDWSEIAELVQDSYHTIAPKTLTRQLDSS